MNSSVKSKIILLSDRATEYFLYLLIFFLPFSQAGIEICFGFVFLAWMVKQATSYNSRVASYLPHTELNEPLLAYVAANAIAVIMSTNFSSSIRPFFSKVLEYVFIFLIVADTINTKKRIRNLLIVIIFSAFFISIDAGVQYFRGVDFLRGYSIDGLRLTASFVSANDFAAWLIVVIFIILGLFLIRQPRKFLLRKLGLGILVLLLLVCLGLTYSRGAWIGFLIGLIIIVGYKISRLLKRRKILSALLMIGFAISIFFILPFSMQQRIETMKSIESASPERLILWREAISIIKDYPIFGSGLGTYMDMSSKYSLPGGGQGGSYPHNAYLHMLAEIGIIGLLSFLWIIGRLFKLVIRSFKKSRDPLLLGLFAGIIAFLVHSFFDTNFYSLQLSVLFWAMLGLTIAKTENREQKTENRKQKTEDRS